MEVDDAIEGLDLVLLIDPVTDGPQVVAYMRGPRGLDAAEDALPPNTRVLVQGYSPRDRSNDPYNTGPWEMARSLS